MSCQEGRWSKPDQPRTGWLPVMGLVKWFYLGRLTATPMPRVSLETSLVVPDFFPLSLRVCACILGSVWLLNGNLKILYFHLSDNGKEIKTSMFQTLRLASYGSCLCWCSWSCLYQKTVNILNCHMNKGFVVAQTENAVMGIPPPLWYWHSKLGPLWLGVDTTLASPTSVHCPVFAHTSLLQSAAANMRQRTFPPQFQK